MLLATQRTEWLLRSSAIIVLLLLLWDQINSAPSCMRLKSFFLLNKEIFDHIEDVFPLILRLLVIESEFFDHFNRIDIWKMFHNRSEKMMILDQLLFLTDCFEIFPETDEGELNVDDLDLLAFTFVWFVLDEVIDEGSGNHGRRSVLVLKQLKSFFFGCTVKQVHGAILVQHSNTDNVGIIWSNNVLPFGDPSRKVAYRTSKLR